MPTNPYENPYQQQSQQNPYQQPQQSQPQQSQPQQSTWGGPQNQGSQPPSIYNAYTQNQQPQAAPPKQSSPNWGWPTQPSQPPQQQQPVYGAAQPGSAPQGSYPQQYNYTQPQPQYSQFPTSGWGTPYQQTPSQGQPGGWPTGGQPQQPQQSASWNTDGFTRPQTIAQKYAPHPMPGWDRAKWADPNHQTPKYVIGRLLSGIKPRTENMDQAVALIAQAYPGTRRTGSGDITIPGIGSTDILQAADVGGKAWHFGGQSKAAKPVKGAAAQPAAVAAAPAAADPYTALLQSLVAPQAMPEGTGRMTAESWEQTPQYQAMAAQMAQLQQQMSTWTQQQQAAAQASAARGPQFSYY